MRKYLRMIRNGDSSTSGGGTSLKQSRFERYEKEEEPPNPLNGESILKSREKYVPSSKVQLAAPPPFNSSVTLINGGEATFGQFRNYTGRGRY